MPNPAEITVDHEEYSVISKILEEQLRTVQECHKGFMNTGDVGDTVNQTAQNVRAANERLWEPKPVTPLIDLGAVAKNDAEFGQPSVA